MDIKLYNHSKSTAYANIMIQFELVENVQCDQKSVMIYWYIATENEE